MPAPIAGPAKVLFTNSSATPESRKTPKAATHPGLHVSAGRDSPGISPTSKTADLGLKAAQDPTQDSARSSEPAKARSRVAAALASVRAAMAAGQFTAPVSANPTLASDTPLNTARPRTAGPAPNARQASVMGVSNGTRSHARFSPQLTGARLVSVADGVQFQISADRTVLGRAGANRDRVDIDLSKLRRGAERISHRHAEIIRHGTDYFVRDLGSLNGTYIAGRGRLGRDQLYKLKDHDELVLGSAKLQFQCD
jgi:pSer/pThr/pTyr-binding forkhead associated (FHA) protein